MDIVVDGIHCGGCIGRIERSLKALDGVSDARLNFTNKRLTLTWKATRLSIRARPSARWSGWAIAPTRSR